MRDLPEIVVEFVGGPCGGLLRVMRLAFATAAAARYWWQEDGGYYLNYNREAA